MACSSAGNRCSLSTGERRRRQSGGFLVASWIGGESEPPLFRPSWLKLGSFPALLIAFLVFLILRNFPLFPHKLSLAGNDGGGGGAADAVVVAAAAAVDESDDGDALPISWFLPFCSQGYDDLYSGRARSSGVAAMAAALDSVFISDKRIKMAGQPW